MLSLVKKRKLGASAIPSNVTTLSISWFNNQFYDNPADDQDDATKVSTYEYISNITGPNILLMGVILDNSSEGYISNPQDIVQNVIGPLQNYSSATFGLNFGGTMAWDYADDLDIWNGTWGSTAFLALFPGGYARVTPHVHAELSTHAGRPSAHAGPSRRPHGLFTKTPTLRRNME